MLATIRRDGRPQLSNILYFLDDDGRITVSVTQTRATTKISAAILAPRCVSRDASERPGRSPF
ncbi:MAG TPA: pyridoxamine 5'-phosphate oxidase family protein [Candidatus Dormibacteraeota bacterium]|nr:pyridoxamine 5'-phosphate oxidase family protein [Candidatus Dormibacteraeota bacterium]